VSTFFLKNISATSLLGDIGILRYLLQGML
jgi:hypothetical protein